MSEQADRYCVVGNPIAQSKSPVIHAHFAEQTNQNLIYEKHLVEAGGFNDFASTFFERGGKGMNVTAPFKGDAHQFADELSERAAMAQAVNTLALKNDGTVIGDNTDGAGLVWDLRERLNWPLSGKKALVIGAGGATRGVMYSLLEAGLSVHVVNRTASKAVELASTFEQFGTIVGSGLDDALFQTAEFDLVINATSASLSGDLPPINEQVISKANHVYDMVYGKEPTPFLSWAKQLGVSSLSDGLGMLVGQAAESFNIWRTACVTQKPDINATYRFLEEEMRY